MRHLSPCVRFIGVVLVCLTLVPLVPVDSIAWARPPCEDLGTCSGDRRTTDPPATAVPTVVPQQQQVDTCTEAVPTLDDFLGGKRRPVGTGDILIWDSSKIVWPTGSMPWETTINYWGMLSDYFSRHQGDRTCPNYDRAEADWGQIEGHRIELINGKTSAEDQPTAVPPGGVAPPIGATAQPAATPQTAPTAPSSGGGTLRPSGNCDRVRAQVATLESSLRALTDAVQQTRESIAGDQQYIAKLESEIQQLETEIKQVQKQIDDWNAEIQRLTSLKSRSGPEDRKDIQENIDLLNREIAMARSTITTKNTIIAQKRADLVAPYARIQQQGLVADGLVDQLNALLSSTGNVLQDAVNALENSSQGDPTVDAQIAAAKQAIAILQEAIAGLNFQIAKRNTNIVSVQNDIAALQNELAQLEGSIRNIQSVLPRLYAYLRDHCNEKVIAA